MSDHEIMTVEEVALYLRVSERTVYDWAQKGEIPCGKLGSAWRFSRKQVKEWVDERLKEQDAGPRLNSAVALDSVLTRERVLMLSASSKTEALDTLINVLAETDAISDRDEFLRGIWNREVLMSTGIGLGIGIPHVRLSSIKDVVMAVGICRPPLKDYIALDEQPVEIIFMIAARTDQHSEHLRLLSSISARCKNEQFRQKVSSAKNSSEVYDILVGRDGS